MTLQITKNISVNAKNMTDEMGLKRTVCEIIVVNRDGITTHYPTYPPIKMTTTKLSDSIGDLSVKLNKSDLESIFDDFITNLLDK